MCKWVNVYDVIHSIKNIWDCKNLVYEIFIYFSWHTVLIDEKSLGFDHAVNTIYFVLQNFKSI